ncbi:MAG: methyltransferase [Clostridium sp.]|nr:methyltransferase [Clostridium sp.]
MFRFKRFSVSDAHCGMKICTDSVLLGAWVDVDDARMVIDLGAGSGILSLMVAQRNPSCAVTAIEIAPGACQDARENFKAYPEARDLRVIQADACEHRPEITPDLIICNPPYFTSDLKSPDAARACARHGEGLLPITAIEIAAKWLSENGRLAMVTPADNASSLIFAAEMKRLRLRRQCLVSQSAGKPATRILWEFSRIDGPCERTSLSLRDGHGGYSSDYVNLTKEFYLNF